MTPPSTTPPAAPAAPPASPSAPPVPAGPGRSLAPLRSSARWRTVGFGLIGLSGFLPNLGALWLLDALCGLPVAPAVALANQAGVLWNFLLTDRLLYGGAFGLSPRPAAVRLVSYAAVSNADLLVRVPLTAWLVSGLGWPPLSATAALLLAFAAARFLFADRLLYRAHRSRAGGRGDRAARMHRGTERGAENSP